MRVVYFVQHYDQSRRLNDLERRISEDIGARYAERHAVGGRTILVSKTLRALPSQFGGGLSPKGRLFGFEVHKDVKKVLGEGAGVVSRHNLVSNVTEQALYFAGR